MVLISLYSMCVKWAILLQQLLIRTFLYDNRESVYIPPLDSDTLITYFIPTTIDIMSDNMTYMNARFVINMMPDGR